MKHLFILSALICLSYGAYGENEKREDTKIEKREDTKIDTTETDPWIKHDELWSKVRALTPEEFEEYEGFGELDEVESLIDRDYDRGYSIIKGCKVVSRSRNYAGKSIPYSSSKLSRRKIPENSTRAAALGDTDGVRCLLKKTTIDPDEIAKDLYYAVRYNFYDIAKLLIEEAGADVNDKRKDGTTYLLDIAKLGEPGSWLEEAREGDPKMIKLLESHGAK